MNHPVSTPKITPPIILAQLIAFVEASIFLPLLAITAILEPMNTCTSSLGVTIAVARVKVRGLTVSKVAMAPLEIE